MRRVLPAVGLFFLSPLVAEFLLGNISLNAGFAVIALAPLYGGGAVLVREVTRRSGRGWTTILLLALAYGVLEESVATQSLFNPNYVGQHLLQPAYIPALGMGAWWTLFVLTLHTVWSIAVPIAIVETFARSRRTTPWLGRVGLVVVSVLFVFGVAVTGFFSVFNDPFVASPAQFVGAAVVIVVLVALGCTVGRRLDVRPVDGRHTPSPWLVGGASLVISSAFLAATTWGNQLPWLLVAGYVAMYVLALAVARYWSASPEWGDAHRLALAGGALLTYAWHAFPQPPALPASPTVDLVGNVIFAAGAVLLLVAAALRLRRPVPSTVD